MLDANTPINQFLNAAAAKQPTPGGGSVTALVGALAATMGEMVVNYTLGKRGAEAHEAKLSGVIAEMASVRSELLGLMESDQHAYGALASARKMDAGPERQAQFAQALAASIDGPRRMGRASLKLLGLANQIVEVANRFLLSDLAVCGDLAMATIRCAVYNMLANVPDVSDAAARGALENEASTMLADGLSIVQKLSPAIWSRVAAPSK